MPQLAAMVENLLVSIDLPLALGGLFAGLMVGLTGMGGAAIVTPMLLFIYGVPAPVAVSTDVVSAAAMKPIGTAVHLRRRTPHMRIVFWLCVGSIPGVIVGAFLFRLIADSSNGPRLLRLLIGAALLLSVGLSLLRLRLRRYQSANSHKRIYLSPRRRFAIALAGLMVGTLVGLTSVGSGTLVGATLMLMFPAMLPSRLVGTDLTQAVPLLAVGSLAHWGLGEIDASVLVSLLLGEIPGIWLGARVSSHYNGQLLRLLVLTLVAASGLALVGLPTAIATFIVLAGSLGIGIPIIVQVWRERRATGPAPTAAPTARISPESR